MTFAEDRAAGKNASEIASLVDKIEPHLRGHSRSIIILACMRLIVAMLAPANMKTRQLFLEEMPKTMRKQLEVMDESVQ